MYVDTDNVTGFAELQNKFGIPEALGAEVELFGPYYGDDCEGFWSYDPEMRLWRQHHYADRSDLSIDNMTGEERRRYECCTLELTRLAPPATPVDGSTVLRGKPFVYMDYRFQWLFIPELNRWELLPLGRHSRVTFRAEGLNPPLTSPLY